MNSKVEVKGKVFGEERALYNSNNIKIVDCKFEGPEDGESALKESSDIEVENCEFSLRYPFWHVTGAVINNIKMNDTCRAPMWYSKDVSISSSVLLGPKNVRECEKVEFNDCEIESAEFGWKSKDLLFTNTSLKGEYCFFNSSKINLINFKLDGKYSFQYVKDLYIKDSTLNTKDAFWHVENGVVENSYIKGEYLGWYSKNIKFINCTIEGTQPLCYCKNLELINCKMIDADFAFENSSVEATIDGTLKSIKNPLKGTIYVDSECEVIMDDKKYGCCGKVVVKQ